MESAFSSLISLIQPLIGSQGPCSALSADATMTHFLPLWCAGTPFGIEILRIGFSYAVFLCSRDVVNYTRSIDLALQNDVTKPSLSESWKVS